MRRLVHALKCAPVAYGVAFAVACAGAPAIAAPVRPLEAPPSATGESPFSLTERASFLGQDPYDDVYTVAQLRALEKDIRQVAANVRPAVVLLKIPGDRGYTTGTGVIISPSGLVATCGHVGVYPGRSLEAVLSDGRVIPGVTLGQVYGRQVDCGLVQLELEEPEDGEEAALPWAPLGSTVGLARGDWILAMGHTHGGAQPGGPPLLRVGRVLRNEGTELCFDAPIDAGDSGGPSFNLRGEVVGLNSRCGRHSWENVATTADALRQRMGELREQTEGNEGAVRRKPRRQGPPMRFPLGTSDAGKLAVQRDVRLSTITAQAQRSMVRVLAGSRPLAYGTVVDGRGLVVTKGSLLPAREEDGASDLLVQGAGRARYPAQVVARDLDADVALLRVALPPGERLHAVTWGEEEVSPGTVLVTPRFHPHAPALGFAAIELRQNGRDSTSTPYMGVTVANPTPAELERAGVKEGVRVEDVARGMPAERAGIEPGDILLALNGQPLRGRDDLRRRLNRHRIGERVVVDVWREGHTHAVEVVLAPRLDQDGRLRRGNTTTAISLLSSGLGPVLAHDSITEPDQMGGPLVDLDGRVVGMNIARYDRTATHAIPASRMRQIVTTLIEQARQARESRPGQAAPGKAPAGEQ